jgi:cytochrome c oxidase subunit 2
MHISILLISLLGMGFIAAVFAFVVLNSGPRDEDFGGISTRGYLIRRWWMIGLCAAGVLVSVWSLIPFPLQASNAESPKIIQAVGRQWSWELASNSVEAGEPVRFRVTSLDVNHGFAIYGPDDKIVAQTQAMPGYFNDLDVTFEHAGKYRVLCLEYCGVAHHAMVAEIAVTEKH